MSKKLKTNNMKKISNSQNMDNSEDEEISISFKFITNNSKYNFDFFKNCQKDEKSTCLNGFFKRIFEANKVSWKHSLSLTKTAPCGLETIYYSQLRFESTTNELNKASKIYVMRFDTHKGSNEGRIIGFKRKNNPTFYIIGLDFNHNAYDHGS